MFHWYCKTTYNLKQLFFSKRTFLVSQTFLVS